MGFAVSTSRSGAGFRGLDCWVLFFFCDETTDGCYLIRYSAVGADVNGVAREFLLVSSSVNIVLRKLPIGNDRPGRIRRVLQKVVDFRWEWSIRSDSWLNRIETTWCGIESGDLRPNNRPPKINENKKGTTMWSNLPCRFWGNIWENKSDHSISKTVHSIINKN